MYMKKHHWKYGQMEFWKLAHAICNLHLWYNFALLLQENYALVFSQSEACNFFMYIIKHCNNLVQVLQMTSWSHLNHLYIEEIKSNPQVYTTQEGIREIKNNPQVYTTQEGIMSHYLPTFILISSILQTLDYLDYKAHDSPQVWIIKVWPYSQLSGYTVRLKLYKNNYRKINHLMHQLHLRKLINGYD